MTDQELNSVITSLQFTTGRDIPNRLNAIEARLVALEQKPDLMSLVKQCLNDQQNLQIHLDKVIADFKVLNDKVMILTQPVHVSPPASSLDIKKLWKFWQ